MQELRRTRYGPAPQFTLSLIPRGALEPLRPHPTMASVRIQHPRGQPEPTGPATRLQDAVQPYRSSVPKQAAESEGVRFTGSRRLSHPGSFCLKGSQRSFLNLFCTSPAFGWLEGCLAWRSHTTPCWLLFPKLGSSRKSRGKDIILIPTVMIIFLLGIT